MQFGLFYEHQVPQPWTEGSELRVFNEIIEQVKLADRLGYDCMWEVEHHFLEEYSHSSAPEVFLAACARETKNIHLGTSIALMPPPYRHPVRVAETIATLDLVSGGRVEWGTGESATGMELDGFGVDPARKSAMWREAVEHAAHMLAMTPYPGHEGEFFRLPCRNIVPKSVQKPHPPLWVACSRRETIHRAARHGLGALAFAFIDPRDAGKWVQEYYDIIRSEECIPLGHAVNANVALISGMHCDRDEQTAIERGLDGFMFFGFSLGYWGMYGDHTPGRSHLWQDFLRVKDTLPANVGRGGIGTPGQIREHCLRYEEAGVDQVILATQHGWTRHDHICESLELFAQAVMPEFKAREAGRLARKQAELAPWLEAAMRRKTGLRPLADSDIPRIKMSALKKQVVNEAKTAFFGDRAIPIPMNDPLAPRG